MGNNIAGTIAIDGIKIAFTEDNYKFTFILTDNKTNKIELIPDENGYVWGRLFDDNAIAIYTKDSVCVNKVCVLNTWNYIIFNRPINIINGKYDSFRGFEAIEFSNGAIKSINPCWAIHRDYEKAKEISGENAYYIVYKYNQDDKKFVYECNGEEVQWIFGSTVNSKFSIDEGISLENTNSVLFIEFARPKYLDTFYDYYGYIQTMVGFLTYRRNTTFEPIKLKYKSENRYLDLAKCYVKWAEYTDGKSNIVEHNRSALNSINIKWLDDNSFKKLIDCIIAKDMILPIEILPDDDNDARRMRVSKIKSICSALEVEINAAKIRVSKQDELTHLIDAVKSLIDECNSNSSDIPQGTFDTMYSSIGHWGDSLTDRIIAAWNIYLPLITPKLTMMNASVANDDVKRLVKARNTATHSGNVNLDDKLADTAYWMLHLIYAMAMKRIGLSDEVIKDTFLRGLI